MANVTYNRTTWSNGEAPYIDDTNLNNIEQGIVDLTEQGNAHEATLTTVGSTTVSFATAFTNYSEGSEPHFYKWGKVVTVRGIAKPSAAIAGGQSSTTMFTVPTGYRPACTVTSLAQGSGRHVWLFSLNTSGAATFSRLRGDTGAYIDAGTSEWLPFTVTYICAE